MFRGLFRSVRNGTNIINTVNTSISDKYIKNKIIDLLYNPYYLSQGKCKKHLNELTTKTHKYNKRFTIKKSQLNILNEIANSNFKYGRSSPERFYKGVIELVIGNDDCIILGKKIQGYELDIYIPKIKLVFEIQGKGFHYDSNTKIYEDTLRCKRLLSLDCVDDVIMIIPESDTTSTVKKRYTALIKILPFIVSKLNENEYKHTISGYYKNNCNDTILNQELIGKFLSSINNNLDFTF